MEEYSTVAPWQVVNENGLVFDQGSLMAYFHDLLDPRHARGKRYSLVTLMALVFLAKLSGMDSPSAIADWCQAHAAELVALLRLTYPKMLGHSTFRRLFAQVIGEEDFEQRMRDYNVWLPDRTNTQEASAMKDTTRIKGAVYPFHDYRFPKTDNISSSPPSKFRTT